MHKIWASWNHWRHTRRGSITGPVSTWTAWAGITTAATFMFLPPGASDRGTSPASSAAEWREARRSVPEGRPSASDVLSDGEKAERSRSVVASGNSSQPAALGEAELRELLAGEWRQQYYGKRCLTVRTDGTATMVVEPDGLWAQLFGARLEADIEWTLDNGCVNLQITGGTPSDKIDVAARMWGDSWTQSILELTEERLLLLGEDGVTKYDWTRVDDSRR